MTSYITGNQVDALNQQTENNVKNILQENDSYLESDVDEQLIVSIPFNQRKERKEKKTMHLITFFLLAVKIHSLKIKVPNTANAPKTIKLYTNRQALGFDDADSTSETQTIELSPKDFEEDAVVNLRFVKYQNVTHITLFVVDNQEEEETTMIQQLIFIGTPVEVIYKQTNKQKSKWRANCNYLGYQHERFKQGRAINSLIFFSNHLQSPIL